MATSKQIDFITSLAKQAGYSDAREAAIAYGMQPAFSWDYDVSTSEASAIIEWLKAPAKSEEQIAAELESARVRAEEKAKYVSEYKDNLAAVQAVNEARRIRTDEIMIERGIAHLTGQTRRDARYAITQELKAAGL